MFFLINQKKKVIIGTSPKAGCTHVRRIYAFLADGLENPLFPLRNPNYLPVNIDDYTVVLIIRNPYKRLVSGFLDKYSPGGQYTHMWSSQLPLTFSNFVNKLVINSKLIEASHFAKQTDVYFSTRIRNHKNLIIYDIENIDYTYLGSLFGKIIPEELINFKGVHTYIPTRPLDKDVFDLEQHSYNKYKPLTKYFYNNAIKAQVYNYYKADFDFFSAQGFIYDNI